MINKETAVELFKKYIEEMSSVELRNYLNSIGLCKTNKTPSNTLIYMGKNKANELSNYLATKTAFLAKNDSIDGIILIPRYCDYYSDGLTLELVVILSQKFLEKKSIQDFITSNTKYLNVNIKERYESDDYFTKDYYSEELLSGDILYDKNGKLTKDQNFIKTEYMLDGKNTSSYLYVCSDLCEIVPSLNMDKIKIKSKKAKINK